MYYFFMTYCVHYTHSLWPKQTNNGGVYLPPAEFQLVLSNEGEGSKLSQQSSTYNNFHQHHTRSIFVLKGRYRKMPHKFQSL